MNPARFIRYLLIVAACVTLGVAIQQYYRVTLKLQDPLGGHINDFDRWMIMTPQFVHEGAGYVNDQLPTPPLTLLVLAPLSRLPRPLAQFLWVCLKLPLACLVFVFAVGLVRRSGERLTVPAIMLYESFLSYLGLGLQPPMASWGSLIAEGADQLNPFRIYWWLLAFPGGFLVCTLLALNFLGDGLRDAWEEGGVRA